MNREELKKIAENLIDTFNIAGQESIDLYKKGLKIEIKEDGSPVSNSDLKCNELITNETNQYNAMYRCCDAHVCSLTCSRIRYGKILSVDPNLNNPIVWQTIPDIGLNTSTLKRSKSLPKLDTNYSIINIASLETITESNICECDMPENDYTYQTFAPSIILMIIEGIINIIDVIIKIFY